MPHHKPWKHPQSSSKAHARIQQNLIVCRGLLQVTIKLQEQVMKEFGVKRRDMHAALQSFRSGPHEYSELKPLALYHRHQRSREVWGLQHSPTAVSVSDVYVTYIDDGIVSHIASLGTVGHLGLHLVSRQFSSHATLLKVSVAPSFAF